jgi:hypothetical protein
MRNETGAKNAADEKMRRYSFFFMAFIENEPNRAERTRYAKR